MRARRSQGSRSWRRELAARERGEPTQRGSLLTIADRRLEIAHGIVGEGQRPLAFALSGVQLRNCNNSDAQRWDYYWR